MVQGRKGAGRMAITSHTQLDVYKLAFDSANRLYHSSKKFPKEEAYSLTSQMRRASRSVCANLAEAWRKRRYEAHFKSKLSDAEAEAAETQVWISFAREYNYIDAALANELAAEYDQILGKLVNMIRNPDPWILS